MADTYAILPADIASGLPGLFRAGFGQATKPSIDEVRSMISTADAVVTLHMQRATGVAPSVTNDNALLAKDYIRNKVKAEVMRFIYAGNAPQDIANASKPFEDLAKDMLATIDALERERTETVTWGANAMVSSGSTRNTFEW